jgi:hypothetical protein
MKTYYRNGRKPVLVAVDQPLSSFVSLQGLEYLHNQQWKHHDRPDLFAVIGSDSTYFYVQLNATHATATLEHLPQANNYRFQAEPEQEYGVFSLADVLRKREPRYRGFLRWDSWDMRLYVLEGGHEDYEQVKISGLRPVPQSMSQGYYGSFDLCQDSQGQHYVRRYASDRVFVLEQLLPITDQEALNGEWRERMINFEYADLFSAQAANKKREYATAN